jgi:fimbrial chaperone protein
MLTSGVRAVRLLIGAVLALASLPGALAGSFSATPVRLGLPAGATSTSLALENLGDQPVVVQASPMLWRQEGGRDVLTATQDILVSPPIFTIAPGATQTVRVGLMRPADPERELSYRLSLQEVPPPPDPARPGVSVALQLVLPVFVQPLAPARAAPKPVWSARRAQDGAIELTLSNQGTAHVQVVDARLVAEDGAVVGEASPRAYVLPGQSQTWRVDPMRPWNGEALRVTTRSSAGEASTRIGGR